MVIGNNIYDRACDWEWDRRRLGFRAWKSATSDLGSQTCSPTFVDVAGMDFHLADKDDCAIDAGRVSVSPIDFDGQARPAREAWDVGADEVTP